MAKNRLRKKNKLRKFSKNFLIIIFRLILVLTVLEVGLRISGYARLLYNERSKIILPNQSDSYRILVLGESLTNGDCPCWTDKFEDLLNAKSKEIKFKVINKAMAGSVSSTMLSGLESWLDDYQPNMVISMIGINDPIVTAKNENTAIFKKTPDFLDLNNLNIYQFGHYLLSSFIVRLKEIIGSAINKNPIISSQNMPIHLSNPESVDILQLNSLIEQGNITNETFWKIEKALESYIQGNPMNETAKFEMIRLYLYLYGTKDALKSFEQDYEKSNNPQEAIDRIAWYYLHDNRNEDAEQLFEVVSKQDPKMLAKIFTDIGRQYRGKNVFMREEVYNSLPEGDRVPNPEEMKKYIERGEKIGRDYSNLITKKNYLKLYDTLNKRKIRLVAVQYPLLSLDELKLMFNGNEDIVFVSNEENFKKEVKTAKFEGIFRGPDFGVFGHTTKKGADLIADSIADGVLNNI